MAKKAVPQATFLMPFKWLKSLLKSEPIDESTLCHAFEVAEDFSRFPKGITKADGPHSGEALREALVKVLTGVDLPPGNRILPTLVFMDGTMGYGSSFLKEAFGGLVSVEGFTPKYLRHNMRIMSSQDPSLKREIWEYIDTAVPSTFQRDIEAILIDNIDRMNMEGLLEFVLVNPHYLTEKRYKTVRNAIIDAAEELGVHSSDLTD